MTVQDVDRSYHYQVIRRAIDIIDAPGGQALSLEDLSARLGMSPAHFQRVFSAWAGVSPKRYQQYLALGAAKRLLGERQSTLAAAHEAGLSGSGRLHDLFLRWEAMTPGEYALGGDGLTISWGWFDSPFGPVLAMGTEKGLCGMGFADKSGSAETFADLRNRWPSAQYVENPAALADWVAAAFRAPGAANSSDNQGPRLHLIGAPFQIKVWEALLAIPSGQVTTYSDIAARIGHPSAVRAVGTAVGRNPVSWLIPCHRALRKSGGLGGYHWGLERKRAMLAWEAVRAEAS